MKRTANMNQYIVFIVGALFFILGMVILTRTILVDNFTIWLPITIILAGILILPGRSRGEGDDKKIEPNSAISTIAFVAILIGGYLILRITGVVSVPILQYVLGGGLGIIGMYSMLSSVVSLFRSSHNSGLTS